MTKWIGSILILVASSGLGICQSQELKKHLDELEALQKLFYMLKSELQYTRAPFAELFEKIGNKMEKPYSVWLLNLSRRLREKGTGSFWEIWCLSIAEDMQVLYLKKEELEELKNVGKSLEYTESLDLYMEQMEYRITHTRKAYETKRKLYRSMGIMGGIFLVILLL